MGIFLSWIVFSFVAGFIGSGRNIGFFGAFFLALILSPIIGILFALISKDKQEEEYKRKFLEAQQNKYPNNQQNVRGLSDLTSYSTNSYSSNTNTYSRVEEIEKLENLRRNASITEEEYRNLKAKIINS